MPRKLPLTLRFERHQGFHSPDLASVLVGGPGLGDDHGKGGFLGGGGGQGAGGQSGGRGDGR